MSWEEQASQRAEVSPQKLCTVSEVRSQVSGRHSTDTYVSLFRQQYRRWANSFYFKHCCILLTMLFKKRLKAYKLSTGPTCHLSLEMKKRGQGDCAVVMQ